MGCFGHCLDPHSRRAPGGQALPCPHRGRLTKQTWFPGIDQESLTAESRPFPPSP